MKQPNQMMQRYILLSDEAWYLDSHVITLEQLAETQELPWDHTQPDDFCLGGTLNPKASNEEAT